MERCNIVIVDEREIVDKEVIDKVFIPFLTAIRHPLYLNKPEFKHLEYLETNHFIEMSSIGSTTSSMYKEFLQYIDFISRGIDKYAVFCIPYQMALRSGVVNKSIIEKMVREATTSVEAFRQEMEVLPTGEGESSMFTYEDMNKNRRLKQPIYPITDEEYIEYNGNINKYPYYIKKESNEIRILVVDLAVMGNSLNDNSIFKIFRIKADSDEYIVDVPYVEAMNGVNTDLQILRIKQLHYDCQCDFTVLDGGGIGQPFFDVLTKRTEDYTRNKSYPAWKTIRPDDKQDIRVLDKNAEPVVHLIKVSGANASASYLNMLVKARRKFQNKMVNLLVDEDEIVDYLNKKYKWLSLKSSPNKSENDLAVRLMRPFTQTTSLIKEGINTKAIETPTGVKFDEGSGRKDRIICFLYGISFVSELEQELRIEPEDDFNMDNLLAGINGSNNRTTLFGTSTSNPFASRFNGFK